MTRDQIRSHAKRQSQELFDSFVVIGRIAETKQYVILCDIPDDQARIQIILSITNLLASSVLRGSEK